MKPTPQEPSLALLLAGLSYALQYPDVHGSPETRVFIRKPNDKYENIRNILMFIGLQFADDCKDQWVKKCFGNWRMLTMCYEGNPVTNQDSIARAQEEILRKLQTLESFFVTDPSSSGCTGFERIILRPNFKPIGRQAYLEHEGLYGRICRTIISCAKNKPSELDIVCLFM